MRIRRKNICLYKNSIELGGAEKQLIILANRLPVQFFKVYIFARKISLEVIDKVSRDVKIIKLKKNGYLLSTLEVIRYFIRNDIQICHSWCFKSSIIGFIGSILTKTIFVDGSIRSAPSERAFRRKFRLKLNKIKIQLFKALGVFIISNSRAGLESYGVDSYRRSRVIHNALVANHAHNPRNICLYGKYKVAMVANMRWKKDFTTFIKAGLSILDRNKDIYFYLIGNGADKYKYQKLVGASKYPNHFIMTGHVPEPLNYIIEMDVCVLCNNFSGEGLSNSIIEYMYCKKPVIATNIGGNREVVKNKENGYLIEENDYMDLALKILFLLENRKIREKQGMAGYKTIKTICDIDLFINEFSTLYNTILNKYSKKQST